MAKNTLQQAPYGPVYSYVDEFGNYCNVSYVKHHALLNYINNVNNVEWRPNEPFEAELEIVGSSRGRSSAVFEFRDTLTNIHYPVFFSTVEQLLRSATIANGRVRGVWQVIKRGSNYGLGYNGPAE